MKREIPEFIINVIISSFIGLIVGFTEITISNFKPEYLSVIIRDVIFGFSIGTVSRYLFLFLYAKKQNVFLCFVAVFGAIGCLSLAPFVYYNIIGNQYPRLMLLMIVITAEILGLGFSYISYRRTVDINNKLNIKKRDFDGM